MPTLTLNTAAWFGDVRMEVEIPPTWSLFTGANKAQDAEAMSDDQVRAAFANPIGTKRISQLARGRREAVVIFDDLSRPTPVKRLVPHLLDGLREGGIGDDHVRFVAAIGTHACMTRHGFAEKLGEEVVEGFEVYNHHPFEHLDHLGETSRRTPVYINREVMSCDLKIGVGSILPHRAAGLGGGGKIILPGVAGNETVRHSHVDVAGRGPGMKRNPSMGLGPGKVERNDFRLNAEEAARMAGLDVKVDAVVSPRRELVGLFVGDLVEEHRVGCGLAGELYATPMASNCDIVVANAYPVDDEAVKFVSPFVNGSLREGGDAVVIANTPEGQVYPRHYMFGRFGRGYGGSLWSPEDPFPKAGRVFVLTEHPSRDDAESFGPKGKVTCIRSWEETLEELRAAHGGRAKVAVYPYTAVQFPEGS